MFPSLIKLKLFSRKKRTRKSEEINWEEAPDISLAISEIVKSLNLLHVDVERLRIFRSHGSKAYARARIWAFPRIWQQALKLPAYYIIEVISEKFDHLSINDKKRVLIHELMHIPKNFSGSLVSHRGRYHRINTHSVEELFNLYQKASKKL